MTNQETNPKSKKSVPQKKQKAPIAKRNKKLLKTLSVIAGAVLVLGSLSMFAYNYKHLFVVGRVNGKFVTRMELNKLLFNAYGKSGFDELVTAKLIEKEIAEKGVKVSSAQLKERKEKISLQVEESQNVSLEQYLKMQDIPEAEFEDNLKQQLSIEMLFADRIAVSEEEITEFLETYGAQLEGETDEDKRAQVVDILINQQMGTLFQQWLEKSKGEAEIVNYLE